ncbi:hypothetical protein ACWEO4_39690 [Streptomyces sp. NPDC004393]
MQSSDLARTALDALSTGAAATRNDPLPQHLLDRHPTLRGAWQSWRENPARTERATALRVALDEALDRDAELRSWAESLVTDSQTLAPGPPAPLRPPATAPQPPGRPPLPLAAPSVPPAAPYPPGPAAPRTPPGPLAPAPQPYYRQRRFQIAAALALVLALIGVGAALALTGADSGSAGPGGLHHRFALGVQGHRKVNAQVDVTVGEATQPQCAGHAAKGTVYPVTITVRNTGPVSWDTSETPEDDVQPSLYLTVQGTNPSMLVGTDFPVRGDEQGSGSAGCARFDGKQRDALELAVGQRASWTTEVDTAQRAPDDEEFRLDFVDSTGMASAGETWSFRADGSHQTSRITVTPNASAKDPGTAENASGSGATAPGPGLTSATGLGPKPAWTLERQETGNKDQPDVLFFADRIAYVAGGYIRIVKPATGKVTATVPIPADTGESPPSWAQGDWNGTEVIGVTTHTTVPADGLTPERHRTTVRTYGLDGKQLGAFTHDDDQGGTQFLNGWIVTADNKSGTTVIRDPHGSTRAGFRTDTGLLDGSNNLGVYDIQSGHWAFAHSKDAAGLRNLEVYDLAAGGGPKWGTEQKAPRDAEPDTNVSPAVWGVLEDYVLLQWPGGDIYEYDVRTGRQLGRIGAADDRHAIWDADHLLFYSVDGSRAYAYDLTSHRRAWQQDAGQRTFYPETYLAGRLYGTVGSSADSNSGDTSSTVVLNAASHEVLAQNQSFHIKGVSDDGFAAVAFDRPDSFSTQDSTAPYVLYRVAAAPRSGT